MSYNNTPHESMPNKHAHDFEDVLLTTGLGAASGKLAGHWAADKVDGLIGLTMNGMSGEAVRYMSDVLVSRFGTLVGALGGLGAGLLYITRDREPDTPTNNPPQK
ncbi:MAG: hypothetical protein JWO47_154 [Candidatus Saccharibacteria bacterium]|nr:hypothetical protein [Candidatus Saccharibacteria bacterium]